MGGGGAAARPPADSAPGDEPTAYFFKTASSLYAGVLEELRASPRWRRVGSEQRADLVIVERWEVPWARLAERADGGAHARVGVNHIRGSKCVTIKALMVKALRDHLGEAQPALLPETHLIVPGAGLGDEREALRAAALGAPDVRWIAKPTAGAHGDGICVCETAAEALQYVDAAAEAQGAPADAPVASSRRPLRPRPKPTWLVQAYVARPLLYRGGRKFDVRALVGVRHDGAAFFYSQYVARVCGRAYAGADLSDKFAHITNHCVQVEGEDFGKHEDSNEVFSEDIEAYLRELHGDVAGAALHARVVAGMHDAARVLVAAMAERTGHGEHAQGKEEEPCILSFQLIGLDIICDESGDVLLLESNGSPAVAIRMVPGVAAAVMGTLVEPLRERLVAARASGVGNATDDACDGRKRCGHHFVPL